MESFRKELETLINCHSMENQSNTPDFILANYMYNCLQSFNEATFARTEWHKKQHPDSICETAPYPSCNGANGCDTCEHQPEE